MTGELNTVRRTVRLHAVLIPVALIVTDRAITLSHWHLESNPVVNGLGVVPWIGVTVAAVSLLLYLWYKEGMYRRGVSMVCVYFLTLLMGTVVVTNALYVTGLWPF